METRRATKRKRSLEKSSPIPASDSEAVKIAGIAGTAASQQETISYPPAPVPFFWTSEKALALLYAIPQNKPTGLNKFINIQLVQRKLNDALKMVVPKIEIWKVIFALWELQEADIIDSDAFEKLMENNDFELPQTVEATEEASGTSRSSSSKDATSSSSGDATSSSSEDATSRASEDPTSSASEVATSSASEFATSSASEVSTSSASEVSTSSASEVSTSSASEVSTSSANQAATSSSVRRIRPTILEDFNITKVLKVRLERIDSMLAKALTEKLKNYKTDSCKATLQNDSSNINVDVKKKEAPKKVDVKKKQAQKKFVVKKKQAQKKVDVKKKQAQKKFDVKKKQAQKKVDVEKKQAQKKVDVKKKQAQKKVDVEKKQAQKKVDVKKKQAQKKVDVKKKQAQKKVKDVVSTDSTKKKNSKSKSKSKKSEN